MIVRTLYPSNERLREVFAGAAALADPFGSDWTDLPWVGGGGCSQGPKLALVFINPTSRNQSAGQRWDGERAPFIGLRRIWRSLANAGLLPGGVVDGLPPDGNWTVEEASIFYRSVAASGIYVTNLVKACRNDSTLPTMRMARGYRGLMVAELEAVEPELVVGMGGLVTSILSDQPVKLDDEFTKLGSSGSPQVRSIPGSKSILSPSYFPVGRGNPERARVMLSAALAYVEAGTVAGR